MNNIKDIFVSQIQKAYVFIVLGLISMNVSAAAPVLPKIGPAADVTAESDPTNIIVTVFKYVGGIMVWLAVAWFGLQMFWAVIKAVNEARGGDSSWMEAGKSMVGNVMIFILFLAIALWYSAAFLS